MTTETFEKELTVGLERLAAEARIHDHEPARILTSNRKPDDSVSFRTRSTFLGIAAAVALVLGVGAYLGNVKPDVVDAASEPANSTASNTADLTLELGGDRPINVGIGNDAQVGPARVYAGLKGPQPAFDLSTLGEEVTLGTLEPDEFVVPLDDQGSGDGSALGTNQIVVIGEVDGAQLALHTFDNNACIYLGNFTTVTGGGSCEPSDGASLQFYGMDYRDPPVGSWSAVAGSPATTSVVVVEWSNGESSWQQPTASAAFFLHDDAVTAQHFTFLDADGQEIAPNLAIASTETSSTGTWLILSIAAAGVSGVVIRTTRKRSQTTASTEMNIAGPRSPATPT